MPELFIGEDVGHTPARGMKTLFVAGLVPTNIIHDEALRHSVQQVYIGAKKTFIEWSGPTRWWTEMIENCLAEDYWVSLELTTDQLEMFQNRFDRILDNHKFIPVISIALPNIRKLGYNAVLKLDEKGFKETNPGAWYHSLHTLQRRSVFTGWSEYKNDQTLDIEIPEE